MTREHSGPSCKHSGKIDMENFVNALATAPLEPGEERELLWEARQVLGVPMGELRERLATARDHADARRRREGGQHWRRDRRPVIPAPASKAEFTPTLHRLDEELATVVWRWSHAGRSVNSISLLQRRKSHYPHHQWPPSRSLTKRKPR